MFQFLIGNVLAVRNRLSQSLPRPVSIPYRQCLSLGGTSWVHGVSKRVSIPYRQCLSSEDPTWRNELGPWVSIPYRQCLSPRRDVSICPSRGHMFQFLIGNVLAVADFINAKLAENEVSIPYRQCLSLMNRGSIVLTAPFVSIPYRQCLSISAPSTWDTRCPESFNSL